MGPSTAVKAEKGGIPGLVLCVLAHLFGILPRYAQIQAGKALGFLLRFFQFRSQVVRENLERIFPGQKDQQIELYQSSYRHFGCLIFEVLLLLGPLKRLILKKSKLLGLEHLDRALEKGRGVIFLSSHVGNWEIMAATGSLLGPMNLLLVTKLLKPAFLHQAVEAARLRCGVLGTYEPKTLRDVLKHLKQNQCVGIVLDQYAGPPVGVRVPFFKVPVSTSPVLATIAKRTGAVVLPVKNFRQPDGSWSVTIEPPLHWKSHANPNYELALNTAAYVSVVEKHIVECPEQWLWTHRRFKGDLSPLKPEEWSAPRVRR